MGGDRAGDALGRQRPETPGQTESLLIAEARRRRCMGDLAEAESLYRAGLAMRRERLGPEHLDTSEILIELASLCHEHARYVEAEALLLEALSIQERALGDHPRVAVVLHTLGWVLKDQQRYTEAEACYRRSLVMKEQVLGPEHPEVARTLNNLGRLYEEQRRYGEAEAAHLRALAIKEKVLGPHDMSVATSLSNLACVYRLQRRYADAEALVRRALGLVEAAEAANVERILWLLEELAWLCHRQDKATEAEFVYRRAIEMRARLFGEEDLDLLVDLNGLAQLYCAVGRYLEAEETLRRARPCVRKTGEIAANTCCDTFAMLTEALLSNDNLLGAERVLELWFDFYDQKPGTDGPVEAIEKLARLYDRLGRYAEADRLYRHALDRYREVLDADDPDLVRTERNYAAFQERWRGRATSASSSREPAPRETGS